MDKSENEKLAALIINEVIPRAKKYGKYPPAKLVAELQKKKSKGEITHQQIRNILDAYYG